MMCLFCENPVPLVQTLVQRGASFCCDAHRKAYHADTQRLMLVRLMETRKRYRQTRTEVFEPVYENIGPPNRGQKPKLLLRPLVIN